MADKILLAVQSAKNFAKYLIIPTFVVTFMPDSWLGYIRLLELKNSFGVWIAGIFFISVSIVTVDYIAKLKVILDKKNKRKSNRKAQAFLLESLSNGEKAIIKEIYENDSAVFEMSDATMSKLQGLNMVLHSNVSVGLLSFSYCLQPWVTDYLKKHNDYFNNISDPIHKHESDYYD